jgi:hypothetical protein
MIAHRPPYPTVTTVTAMVATPRQPPGYSGWWFTTIPQGLVVWWQSQQWEFAMSNEATSSDTQSVHIPRALRVRDEYKDAVGKMNPATKAYAVWTTAAKLVGPSVFASLV